MSTGHPALNRGLLLVTGAAGIIAGAAALIAEFRPGWSDPLWARWNTFRTDSLPRFESWTLSLPGSMTLPAAVTVIIATALILLLLLIVFLTTAPQSTTSTVLRDETRRGRTAVDRRVAQDVLARPVADLPDVVGAQVRALRLKKGEVGLELTVHVRRGADLPAVSLAAEEAVRDWDLLSGRQSAVLVRLSRRPLRTGHVAARVS